MSEVSVENLKVAFGPLEVVHGVDFVVPEGRVLSLLGPSGCGKSTILRVIAGLLPAGAGIVRVGAVKVTAPAEGIMVAPEARDLGMVFQSYAIWPHMSVAENVGFPLKVRGRSMAERAKAVQQILDIVGLGTFGDRPATQLSGGQQQRVAIARALVAQPKVLLLDEPLSNLDTKLRAEMITELKMIQKRTGVTTIFVTHDQAEALSLSDRIVVLRQGHVCQTGDPATIYERPADAFAGWFIGRNNFIGAELVALRPSAAGEPMAAISVTELGLTVTAPAPGVAGPPGTKVILAVRPEDVRLGDPDGLPARILASDYTGERRTYTASLGGWQVGFAGPRDNPLREGEEVRLGLAAPRIFAMDDEVFADTLARRVSAR